MKEEADSLRAFYNVGTYEEFRFELWGAGELIDAINSQEKKAKQVDWKLPIEYDTNIPSLVKLSTTDIKGLICTVKGTDIASLAAKHGGAIFDRNVRNFLGEKGGVNPEIVETCSNPEVSNRFWFLNNGITIVCDHFSETPLPNDAHVKMRNLQIVNGCQTTMALSKAQQSGLLGTDVRVLVRIYETTDSQLEETIVRTTNNQNRISSRDLHSNDPVQVDMQSGFLKYDLYYERKAKQYDSGTTKPNDIVSNEVVGQSYLGVVLKKPSDARRRKYKIWEDYYNEVFPGKVIEPHVLSYLISKSASLWLQKSGAQKNPNELKRKLAKNAAFHLARMTSFGLLGDKWADTLKVADEIKKLKASPKKLDSSFESNLKKLTKLVKKQVPNLVDLDAYLKSATLDQEIEKVLYSKKAKSTG